MFRITLLVIAFLCANLSTHAQIERNALIRNVTIISPQNDSPLGPIDVSIKIGRIAEIGENLASDSFTKGEIIDGTEKYLTPGLIDSHVHLTTIPGMHGGHEAEYPEIANAARQQIPLSYLYHGFTTVIDLISEPDTIADWNEKELRPHAYFCAGAPIIDGYPTSFIPKPARYYASPNFLYDPARADEFPEGFDPLNHTPKAVVGRIAEMGAIGVKTFYEDGFGDATDLPVPSEEVLRDLVAAAHEKGLPVIVHANAENAQRAGVNAGVDAFVHGLWTWDSEDAPELTQSITDILDGVIEKNIACQPTIQVLFGERDLFDPDFLSDPELRTVVPQSVIDWYASDAGQWMAEDMRAFPFVTELESQGRWNEIDADPIRHVSQALTYLAQNGGHLLFGTDTPSAPTYANPIGLNGRREMDRWIEAGVSPKAVLKAATQSNAAFFKLDSDIGSIEVGKQADLLLLGQNPLDSIGAYDTIELVLLAGRPIERSELAAK